MSQSLTSIIADLNLQIASGVAVGNTTASLATNTDADGVAIPAGKYGFTIDNNSSSKEYIIADVSGTNITGVISISRQNATTVGFTKAHRRGAQVTITDWVVLRRMLDNLNGTTGFDSGTPIGYDGAPASLTGNQFATVNYVLSVVSGGSVTFSNQTINGTAGETLVAGNFVYFKASDQRWWKVDSATPATMTDTKFAVVLTGAAPAVQTTLQLSGIAPGFVGLTAGSTYYASTTGAVSTTQTDVKVGYAWSTTEILMDVENTATVATANKVVRTLGTGLIDSSFIPTSATPTVQVFTASGTYTTPVGLKYAVVKQQGGGGGGGGSTTSDAGAGAGGGSGAYAEKLFVPADLGVSQVVTIGAAGTGTTAVGNNGGTTTFGALLSCTGGSGGATCSDSSTGGAGGVATGGDININGQRGGYGAYATSTNTVVSGAGASSIMGIGGLSVSGVNTTRNGIAATGYGAGGSGASVDSASDGTGGNGTSGVVYVYNYF